jgi:DNA-directed RNA polymerase specialized sigma24 family protein
MKFANLLPRRQALTEIKAIPYALASAVDDHRTQIFRFLLLSVRRVETAERLTCACFSVAYREWLNLSQHTSTTSWLMSIAIQIQRRYTRRERFVFWRQASYGTTSCIRDWKRGDRGLLELSAPVQEHIMCVWKAVDAMGEDEKAIFILRFVEDLNCGDIADATGLEEEAVHDYLLLALHRVRMELNTVSRTAPDEAHP